MRRLPQPQTVAVPTGMVGGGGGAGYRPGRGWVGIKYPAATRLEYPVRRDVLELVSLPLMLSEIIAHPRLIPSTQIMR